MPRRLLEDNRRIAMHRRTRIAVRALNRDSATGNLLVALLDHTERRIWFLVESSRGVV